jgi:hypothetical protein
MTDDKKSKNNYVLQRGAYLIRAMRDAGGARGVRPDTT